MQSPAESTGPRPISPSCATRSRCAPSTARRQSSKRLGPHRAVPMLLPPQATAPRATADRKTRSRAVVVAAAQDYHPRVAAEVAQYLPPDPSKYHESWVRLSQGLRDGRTVRPAACTRGAFVDARLVGVDVMPHRDS